MDELLDSMQAYTMHIMGSIDIGSCITVINHLPKPKIVRLEGWEERELFSDGLDEGF